MRFVWDDRKRAENLRKHGIDFVSVAAMFAGVTFTMPDHRFAYQEQRFLTLALFKERVVAITHTETADTTRIISIRKATRHEEQTYFKYSGFQGITH